MIRRYFTKLLFFLILLSANNVFAQAYGQWQVGLGVLPYNINRTTTSADAKTDMIGPIFYPLSIRGNWRVGQQSLFSPRLLASVLPRESADGSADTRIYVLTAPVTSPLSESFNWNWGLGIFRYEIAGKGGTTELNNGTGTSTFYRASRKSVSNNIVAQTGLGYEFSETISFNLDLFLSGILTERRAYHLLFALNYTFGGSL